MDEIVAKLLEVRPQTPNDNGHTAMDLFEHFCAYCGCDEKTIGKEGAMPRHLFTAARNRQRSTQGARLDGRAPCAQRSPGAAISVPESCEDTTVIGVGFEPEVFLQGLERNHSFNDAMRSWEARSPFPCRRHQLRGSLVLI